MGLESLFKPQSKNIRLLLAILALAALVGWGIATRKRPPDAAEPGSPRTAVETVIFVGDAGAMLPGIQALIKAQAALASRQVTVIFLGDNVYPNGVPAETAADYPIAKMRLLYQIEAVKAAGAHALFIPGNHDWYSSSENDCESIRREQALVESELGPQTFQPRNCCPGPAVVEPGGNFELIIIDSEWWLAPSSRVAGVKADCANQSEQQLEHSLLTFLGDRSKDGKFKIVLSHHPLLTYSYRTSPIDIQSVKSAPYTHYRDRMLSILEKFPVDLCVAGHDHNLQVLNGDKYARYAIVSGASSYSIQPETGPNTIFSSSTLGLVRLDFYEEGRKRLSVIVPDAASAAGRTLFETQLK